MIHAPVSFDGAKDVLNGLRSFLVILLFFGHTFTVGLYVFVVLISGDLSAGFSSCTVIFEWTFFASFGIGIALDTPSLDD